MKYRHFCYHYAFCSAFATIKYCVVFAGNLCGFLFIHNFVLFHFIQFIYWSILDSVKIICKVYISIFAMPSFLLVCMIYPQFYINFETIQQQNKKKTLPHKLMQINLFYYYSHFFVVASFGYNSHDLMIKWYIIAWQCNVLFSYIFFLSLFQFFFVDSSGK